MVFEKIFKTEWLVESPAYFLFLGVIITVISFFTSFILFHHPDVQGFIGISTIMFIVIITIPTMENLFDYQEKIEKRKDITFFEEHKIIIDFFTYFFIGVFVTFFILSLVFPGKIFSEDQLYGKSVDIEPEIKSGSGGFYLPPPPTPFIEEVKGIFLNNIYVGLVAFMLSFLFGSGSLFLIALNSSIFAVAITNLIQAKIGLTIGFIPTFSFIGCNFGVMLSHTIPELSGYFFAAIAGGILSELLLKDKIKSKDMLIGIRNSLILIAIGVVILFVAALSEVGFSKAVFQGNLCLGKTNLTIVVLSVIVVLILLFDYLTRDIRKKETENLTRIVKEMDKKETTKVEKKSTKKDSKEKKPSFFANLFKSKKKEEIKVVPIKETTKVKKKIIIKKKVVRKKLFVKPEPKKIIVSEQHEVSDHIEKRLKALNKKINQKFKK